MKSHRTDRVSLFFGLAFLLVAGTFLAHQVLNVDLPDGRWFVAGGLILFGLLGVLGALMPNRSRKE
jgi:hypothetical protein